MNEKLIEQRSRIKPISYIMSYDNDIPGDDCAVEVSPGNFDREAKIDEQKKSLLYGYLLHSGSPFQERKKDLLESFGYIHLYKIDFVFATTKFEIIIVSFNCGGI